MKMLTRIRVVQFFLYEQRDFEVALNTGIFGPNGSGKSSLLDAVQIVMLGANESRGHTGVSFNAQADESNRNTRSIRSYCLGQYGDSNEARIREEATTYITLVWHDTKTREVVSTGVCIAASASREDAEVLGRYVVPVELSLSDHLVMDQGVERPRAWASFRQMLSQRAPQEEVHFRESDRFLNALLFKLRGSSGVPRLDAYRRAFRFGLRMKFDKSVDSIVREQVLEPRPTKIKYFKDVLTTFREMAELVRQTQLKLAQAEAIEADFSEAQRRNVQAVTFHALECEGNLHLATEGVTEAEEREGKAHEALEQAADSRRSIDALTDAAVQRAKESALARDQHSSHAGSASLATQLASEEGRLAEHAASLVRHLGAINRAISQKLPGLLVSDSDITTEIASKNLSRLLQADGAPSREDFEVGAKRALKAARLLSQEVLAMMQSVGREQSQTEEALRDLKENLERVSAGKPMLEGPALALRRELSHAGINALPVCDLVKVDVIDWQPVIEAFLGLSNLQALLVDEADERKAFGVYRSTSIFEAKIVMPSKFSHRASPPVGSVAEVVSGTNAAAVNFIRAKLGDYQRADSEDECFSHRYAMTTDGMLVANGEMLRKRPVHTDKFRIGETSALTRSNVTEEVKRLERDLAGLVATFATLKVILSNLGPFAGDEREKMLDLMEAFDAHAKARTSSEDLRERLNQLDTREYRAFVQAVVDAEEAVAKLREQALAEATAYGAAQSRYESARETVRAKVAFATSQAELVDVAKSERLYDRDYASEQWERLSAKHGDAYASIAAECKSRSFSSGKEARKFEQAGMTKLGSFQLGHDEVLPAEAHDDWEVARAWLVEKTTLLRNTGLHTYQAKMEAALETAKSTFRNDVAVLINENLEWLEFTMNRLNEALRAAPTFTNGERYQFRWPVRPAYQALAKFIKDVAAYGPTDDLFGGAGEMPKEFEELMLEKTLVGAGSVKSPLDDYREFFEFDVEVQRVDSVTGIAKRTGLLSKRVGSGSGGEHRSPLYVIAGAAIASAYRLERGDDSGLRLLVIDEAFIKMDPRNMVATMRYFEELGLQVLMASTGEALGTLMAFLDRYYDIMRDPESNIVVLEGHSLTSETKELFRSDLPEFHPHLIEDEVVRRFARASTVAAEAQQ
ncbi:SbcC/MukB-like Walker B domain-containing protein [Achromobacter xylosoxidans]|uniref:SbcC/MukB-like Walker B domain-containing protein n=1 Tax=Alcaligenes xylosoxydans xylosoxydans TaxID=85698 RepID=UPI001F12C0C8|nr:SbcC/MukB-like Walker B domain-containing protein [Achromobacter xylosoxidans]